MTKRNATIEYARFVGSLGIVWFHVHAPGGAIGYSALSLFTVLLVYFVIQKTDSISIRQLIISRTKRLLLPWAIWSALYFIAKAVDAILDGRQISGEFSDWMFFTGPAIHLWFLPFSFLASILVYVTFKFISKTNNTLWAIIFCSAYIGIAILCSYLLDIYPHQIPIAQWISVTPALIFGAVLYFTSNNSRFLFVLIPLIFVLYIVMTMNGLHNLSLQIFIASILSIVAVHVKTRATTLSASLDQMSLGIYLIHPMIFVLISRNTGTEISSVLLAVLVSILTCGAVYCITLTRYARYLM